MKRVVWTCDRCSYTENTAEHIAPKIRDFFTVEVLVYKLTTGHKTRVQAKALWCSQCSAEMKVLPVTVKVGKEGPTPPSLEDIVYEIASEAANNAMDR